MTAIGETARPAGGIDREAGLKALALFAVGVVVYLSTRTRHFSGDDTVFALVVQRFLELGVVEPVFLHPHHLLYNPLVAAAALAVRAVSGSVFVLDVGAAVSAVAGAAAVALLYLLLSRSGVGDGPALLASAALLSAGGFWRYATRMEVYTLAALGVVVWLATVGDRCASWRKLALGMAAPWLGHSVLGLLLVPAVLLHRRRPRTVAAALAAGVVLPGMVASVMLAAANDATTPAEMIEVVRSPVSAHYLSIPDPVAALSALDGLVVWGAYRELPVYSEGARRSFETLAWLALVAVVLLLARGGVAVVRRRVDVGVAALAGIAALVPLWLVWDVGNTEHAVAAAPLFAVLVAFGASAAPARIGAALLAVAVASMLVVNGVGSAVLGTQPQLSRTLQVAYHIREQLPADATVISVGIDHEYRLALPYLCGRKVVSLTSMVHAARRAGARPEDALLQWLRTASAAREPWFLEEFDGPPAEDWVVELGVSRDAWRWALAHFTPGRAVVLPADGVAVRAPVTLRRVEVVRP